MNVLDPHPDGKEGSASRGGEAEAYPRSLQVEQFEYVKYFKPLGVTCSTDLRIHDNIIDSIETHGYRPRHRVYPVGRLDKETSGLILLTSDGRLVNSVLRGEKKQPKVYKVMVDGRLEDHHLQRLRSFSKCILSNVLISLGWSYHNNSISTQGKITGTKYSCSQDEIMQGGTNRTMQLPNDTGGG
eukprot:scaffold702_cov220-Chaetoceros_neogracile.AAC.7